MQLADVEARSLGANDDFVSDEEELGASSKSNYLELQKICKIC